MISERLGFDSVLPQAAGFHFDLKEIKVFKRHDVEKEHVFK